MDEKKVQDLKAYVAGKFGRDGKDIANALEQLVDASQEETVVGQIKMLGDIDALSKRLKHVESEVSMLKAELGVK